MNGTNHSIEGFADLYGQMLEVKNGTKHGGIRGFTWITKKQAKLLGIKWTTIDSAAQILGLKMQPYGKYGYSISK